MRERGRDVVREAITMVAVLGAYLAAVVSLFLLLSRD